MDKVFEIAQKLKWPFAIAMLAFLVYKYQAGVGELLRSQKDWGYFLLGFVLIAICAGLTFVRWYLLVWAQEFDFSLKDAFRLGGFGMLCNYGGPGVVGGDIIKAAIVAKNQQSRRAVAAATVVLDRILGLLALFMVGALATLFIDISSKNGGAASAAEQQIGPFGSIPMLDVVWWGLWIGSLGGAVGLCIMLTPGTTQWPILRKMVGLKYVGKTLGDLLNGVAMYQTKRRVVAVAVAISLIGHTGLVAGFYCCALSLKSAWVPGLWEHYFFMPAAELFASIIPLPGGVGPLEGAIAYFYQLSAPASVTTATAASIGLGAALAFRVINVAVSVLGFAYYSLTKPANESTVQEVDSATKKPERKPKLELTT